jgi:hypothetical protein
VVGFRKVVGVEEASEVGNQGGHGLESGGHQIREPGSGKGR